MLNEDVVAVGRLSVSSIYECYLTIMCVCDIINVCD